MQDPLDGLIYLVALAVACLATCLYKRFGPKMKPEPPHAEPDEWPMAQEPVPVGPAAASVAAASPLLVPLRRPQVAVAKAVILGPCRALEPDAITLSYGR